MNVGKGGPWRGEGLFKEKPLSPPNHPSPQNLCTKREEAKAVSTILPCTDSMILSEDGQTVTEPLDRSKIYVVQTPQSFKLDLLRSAHKFAQTLNIYDSTDDASLMKLLNQEVKLVQGNKANMKLTTEEDLIFIKAIFENLQAKEEE